MAPDSCTRGIFPPVSRFTGIHSVAKASENSEIQQKFRAYFWVSCTSASLCSGPCVQLNYRITLMEDNQAGRLRELVRCRAKGHHGAEFNTGLH